MSKKVRKKNKPAKLALTLLPIAVIFAALFVASKTFGSVVLSNVTDAFAEFAAGVRTGGAFSYAGGSQGAAHISRIKSGLLLLSGDAFEVVSPGGARLLSERTGFASPAASVRSGRAVVFDQGGKGLVVTGTTKRLAELTTDFPILDAAVSRGGAVAVATLAKGATSELTVYDTHMRPSFKWLCAADYISDIAFSRDGKRVAAIAIGVREAELVSRLLLFDLDKMNALAAFEYPGTTLFEAEFTPNGGVIVVGDNLRGTVSADLARADGAFADGGVLSLNDFAENGASAMVVLPFGDENHPKLLVYPPEGEKFFEKRLDQKALGVSRSRGFTAVLFRDGAAIYNNAGEQVGRVALDESAVGVVVTDRAVFVRLTDRVEKYALGGQAAR